MEFARYLTDETGPMKDNDTFFGMLDEKWFYFNLLEKAVWIDKDEEKPTYFVKNKQFPTKVMFLGALGMPRPEHDFTGDIGLFPIGVLDFAQRNSVNRWAGTLVFEPMEIDRALTVHMLKHHILPQTLNRCKWAKRIVWVLDNAGGHGGGRGDMQTNVLDPINEWAKDLPQDIKALCGDPETPARHHLQGAVGTLTRPEYPRQRRLVVAAGGRGSAEHTAQSCVGAHRVASPRCGDGGMGRVGVGRAHHNAV